MSKAVLRVARVAAVLGALLLVPSVPVLAQDHGHGGGGGTNPGDLRSSKHFTLIANVPAVRVDPTNPQSARFTNSDLAFWGDVLIAGNYGGFRVIDIKHPARPRILSEVRCNGAQADVSIWGTLVFVSVDTPQTTGSCTSASTNWTATPNAWEGVRIFDISNPHQPTLVRAVPTACGSHTHTLVPDPDNDRVFVYVSSYAISAGSLSPTCKDVSRGDHKKISIIEVPLANPAGAIVREHALHPDTTFIVGDDVLPGLGLLDTTGCHDISVFMELNLAAAACLSEGQIWDISNPASPVTLRRILNPSIDVWHSAAFSWDGEIVAFGDEYAGAGFLESKGPGCRGDADSFLGGRMFFYEVENPATPLGSFTIPRPQAAPNVCTTHNFNFVPGVRGYVLVSAYYTGGTTVIDASDPADAMEMAYYVPAGADAWSSYWYNGHIYVNDIVRGVDVFTVRSPLLAGAKKLPFLNPQTQMNRVK